MTRVKFYNASGNLDREVEADAGERLLDVAQHEGQPLEGTCEGQMACSTCHVIVTRINGKALPAPSEEEEDLLDFAYGAVHESRLACQIILMDSISEIDVRMPGGTVDASI